MNPRSANLIGTGALASFLGARLARAGYKVAMIGTWQEALEAFRRHGVTVEDDSGSWSVHTGAAHLGDPLPPAPLVLLLVKSHRTEAVACAAARALLTDGLMLTLQNGFGHLPILSAAAGADRVVTGVAFLGATLLGPGHVRDGGGSLVVLQRHGRIALAGDALHAAGFEVRIAADIAPVLWTKLAVNCAVNPLTALLRVSNGALLSNPEALVTLESAAREVGTVAAARGIRLEGDPAALAMEVVHETARNRSSMLQDVERGAATEIEALNGAVVREAERLGVPVPVNRRLLEEVRRLERINSG